MNANNLKYKEGWGKMQYVHKNPDGSNTVIHYWKETATGIVEGFKFK